MAGRELPKPHDDTAWERLRWETFTKESTIYCEATVGEFQISISRTLFWNAKCRIVCSGEEVYPSAADHDLRTTDMREAQKRAVAWFKDQLLDALELL